MLEIDHVIRKLIKQAKRTIFIPINNIVGTWSFLILHTILLIKGKVNYKGEKI